jgi:hypothetical protein
MIRLSRRTLVLAGLAAGLARPVAAATGTKIHVSKDPTCPCCEDWVEYLRADGFDVTVTVLEIDALNMLKAEKGLPEAAWSCHTGEVEGYVLEGHVPVADIRRLLSERPDAIGLSVPGMPFGSPGMGPESRREAYDVLLVGKDGTTGVFTSYPAAA